METIKIEALNKLEDDLNALRRWGVQNHLLFNLKKCSISHFQFGKQALVRWNFF